VCPPPDLPDPDADGGAGADSASGAHRGSELNGFPRHRRGGPDGGDDPAATAGPGAADHSVDRLLHNLLIGVGVFEKILAVLDPTTQGAAFTAATAAHDRLRAAFDAVSRNHADVDEWSLPGRDDPPT